MSCPSVNDKLADTGNILFSNSLLTTTLRAIGFYDTHAERQYEKKQFKQAARWKKHHALALGLKNNKTMMTHFVRRDGFCQ